MSEHTSSQYVEDVRNLIYELALKACRKQVLVFSKELKMKMSSLGMERAVIEDVIRAAFQGYSTMQTFKDESSQQMLTILDAYLRPSNRGRDGIGRLITEYGIARAYKKTVLYPDGSRQDDAARENFTKGIIPRPLLRYFLVAVRGSIAALDGFSAKPVLFSEHNEAMQERRETLKELVEEFTTQYNYGKTATDWRRLCDDDRARRIGLELLNDVLANMQSLGAERFLKIVNNVQNSDKYPEERMLMKRPFSLADVKQLTVALTRGRQLLAESLGVPLPN
ncbi:hypothetical protein [Paucidesulfovibrio longus]|uniref:hypothetical protein n=1 Tax=Paucidesulfovibrio longus TaxID=889 RepID=UPI0003B71507|nr:hypothetical protein [Paucidesulfovibrio longus]